MYLEHRASQVSEQIGGSNQNSQYGSFRSSQNLGSNKAKINTTATSPITSPRPVSNNVDVFQDIVDKRKEAKQDFLAASQSDKKYRPECWRWINLMAYVFAMVGTAIMMVTFAPVANNVKEIYETSDFVVNIQTITFFVSYIFINFPAVQALEKGSTVGAGLYYCFKTATLVTVICVWTRVGILYITDEIAWITAPQLVAAFMQPFLMNGCSKLASIWFGPSELTIATALGALSLPIGCVSSFGLGPVFVLDSDADPDRHMQGREAIRHYCLLIAVIITILSMPMLLLYRQKPNTYPSESAEEYALQFQEKLDQGQTSYDFKGELKELLKNKHYLFMATCFTMVYSVYTCLSTIINTITKPFGYTSVQSAFIGIAFVIAGLIGTTIQSILLDMKKNYLQMLRINCIMALLSCLIGLYGLPSGKMAIIIPNISALGFFVLPTFSISYTFAVELTYPISEAMSNGIMVFTSQIMGTLVSFGGSAFLQYMEGEKGAYACIGLFAAIFFIATICSIPIKQELRRMNFGQEGQLKRSQQSQKSSGFKISDEVKDKLLEHNESHDIE